MLVLFFEEGGGEVAFASVGEDDDDALATVFFTLGQKGGCMEGCSGGDAYEDAFLTGYGTGGGEGIGIGDGKDLVDDGGVVVAWDEAGSDALQLVRAGGLTGEYGTGGGFDGYDTDGGVVDFECTGTVTEGATGADASHEDVDTAIGVGPYLLAGGEGVDGRIGGVLELLQDDGSGDAVAKLFGLADGSGHAFAARGEDDLGAIGGSELLTLKAHGVGHGEDDMVATDGTDKTETDTGVATGGFDDGATGSKQSTSLSVVDHAEGYTVFATASRVEGFYFCYDLGKKAAVGGVLAKGDQRSVADKGEYAGVDHGVKDDEYVIFSIYFLIIRWEQRREGVCPRERTKLVLFCQLRGIPYVKKGYLVV